MVRACVAGLLLFGLPGASVAQETGDPRAGLETARVQCAVCHAVERGNFRSVRPEVPAFAAIAAVRGVSGRALAAALHRSHRTMPAVVLPRQEQADVIAYILTLRNE
jgi:mono/diheme cytochrome c family protein